MNLEWRKTNAPVISAKMGDEFLELVKVALIAYFEERKCKR